MAYKINQDNIITFAICNENTPNIKIQTLIITTILIKSIFVSILIIEKIYLLIVTLLLNQKE